MQDVVRFLRPEVRAPWPPLSAAPSSGPRPRRAATELQDRGQSPAHPRKEEITQLRQLICRIDADVNDLNGHDQALSTTPSP
jgi:hypothetical protein